MKRNNTTIKKSNTTIKKSNTTIKKSNTTSIKTRVLALTFSSILLMTVLLIAVMYYSTSLVNSNSIDITKSHLLNQVKSGVQTTTQAVVKNSEVQYNRYKDTMDEDELVDLILDNIRNTKYSDTGYYFVYQYDGTRLVAPENLAQEGQNLWDLTDEAGNKPVQEFIAQSKAGGGFVTYMWVNPSTDTAEEKVSYVAPLVMGDTEVLVGTGTYLPMLQETQELMSSSLRDFLITLLWVVIPSGIALMLVLLFINYRFFMRRMVSPLKEVAAAAIKISEGDTSTVLDVHSNDEIGRVAKTIDNEVRQAFIQVERSRQISEKQAKYQSAQVDKLVVNLDRLAKGELFCDMAVSDADQDTKDIHKLFINISDNLHTSVNTMKGYIEDISQVLGEISENNLDVRISSEYLGDFIKLKESINGIVASLSGVMLEINTAADQVASGTQQVSGGSQEISQGAAEQASSIEELTASVTQIAEQTKLNAASANEASKLTNGAKNDAAQGNKQMKAMQQAMTDINESSENIGKIIKVIDDIAFQTNILALNAAVEAARAGVHGKGFAVVAEEVRNLAARSANAAKETTDLIEGSIHKTEAGTKIANETADALANIVEGVERAAQLVGEIAAASNEQASAIAQVNRGIEQMSQVVQTNSATSEEAAAAAEELSSQAEMLKNLVGQFQIATDAGKTRKPTPEADTTAQAKKPQIRLNDDEFGKY